MRHSCFPVKGIINKTLLAFTCPTVLYLLKTYGTPQINPWSKIIHVAYTASKNEEWYGEGNYDMLKSKPENHRRWSSKTIYMYKDAYDDPRIQSKWVKVLEEVLQIITYYVIQGKKTSGSVYYIIRKRKWLHLGRMNSFSGI